MGRYVSCQIEAMQALSLLVRPLNSPNTTVTPLVINESADCRHSARASARTVAAAAAAATI